MGVILDIAREGKKKREEEKIGLSFINLESWTPEPVCLDLLEEAFLLFLEEKDFLE